MKALFYILLVMLALCGCKTKEKVTERVTEQAHVTGKTAHVASGSTNNQSQVMSTSETALEAWSDSVVEKTYERIVTDSSGRVLQHESERTTEHYKGKGKSRARQQQNCRKKNEMARNDTITETKDSTYNGGILNEVVVAKKKSWHWLWFVGLFVCFLAVEYIISKVIRR